MGDTGASVGAGGFDLGFKVSTAGRVEDFKRRFLNPKP